MFNKNFHGKTRKASATNTKSQQKGAVTTRSNEGVNATAAQNPSAPKRKLDPMWQITALASRKFGHLPDGVQSTASKLACAKAVIEDHKKLCPDMAKYFTWLLEQARRVQRTFDFKDTCEGIGVKPQYVAEHIVLLGKSRWQKVQLEGLATTIPEADIRMYGVSRLVPEEYEFTPLTTKKEGADE